MHNKNSYSKDLPFSPHLTKISFLGKMFAISTDHFRHFIQSFKELWLTPFASAMTILVLGISLALPTAFHLLYKNCENISSQWESASTISVFLKKEVSESRIQVLIKKIDLYDDVESVTYITSHQALTEFKEMSGFSKAIDYLDQNPLPAVLLITPVANSLNSAGTKLLVAKLERENAIDLVRVDIDWIEKIQAILYVILDVVIAVAFLLLLSVLLIVSNTIRLNILNQHTSIQIMKLVGATNSFIRLPFLYTGAWYGFLGALIAWLLSIGILKWVETGVQSLMNLYQVEFQLISMNIEELIILLLTGTLLGIISSYISVKQYLAKITPK